MTGPRVTGSYNYEEGDLQITTESGQDINVHGDSANGCAEVLGVDEGSGEFSVPEGDWENLGRSSFRR